MLTIAIDAMGGDHGPVVTVPAAIEVLKNHPNLKFILVGDQDILRAKITELKESGDISDRLIIQHASEQVMMDELPSKGLRGKKDSSMRVSINLVKNGVANACVSAGNTGALMATARFVLKTLPGIDRPAITASFPTIIPNKTTRVLDLGANVDTDYNYLCQFAFMGSVLSAIVDNVERPRVALLNIGSEEMKGNEQIKKAAQLLSENKNINYVGFIESDNIFKGTVDVIVCDGFIGNIMLKAIEGAIKLVGFYAKRNLMRNLFTKIVTLLALPMLKKLYRDLDPGKLNGATLIGLQGIVIKSHGSAKVKSFARALEYAVIEAEKNIPQRIRDELSKILVNSQPK